MDMLPAPTKIVADLHALRRDPMGWRLHVTCDLNAFGLSIPLATRILYDKNGATKITLVLEHAFSDLTVQADHFEVTLSFRGAKFLCTIPYASIMIWDFQSRENTQVAKYMGPVVPSPAMPDDKIVSLDAFRRSKKDA